MIAALLILAAGSVLTYVVRGQIRSTLSIASITVTLALVLSTHS